MLNVTFDLPSVHGTFVSGGCHRCAAFTRMTLSVVDSTVHLIGIIFGTILMDTDSSQVRTRFNEARRTEKGSNPNVGSPCNVMFYQSVPPAGGFCALFLKMLNMIAFLSSLI
ncbi:unnamed protein product [Somion occarium]|uniref:Uncharacterized protein n=1 Tax=Somion occarium TaxID=3059160 RepID=A0ABP1DSU4_9APHY